MRACSAPLSYPGVPENLLYDADMHTLLHQEGSRRVPGVMRAGVTYVSRAKDRLPLLPVCAVR